MKTIDHFALNNSHTCIHPELNPFVDELCRVSSRNS